MELAGTCPCGRIFAVELCYGYTYFPYHRECVRAGLWPFVTLYGCGRGYKSLNDVPGVDGIDLCSLVNMAFSTWTSLIEAGRRTSEPRNRREEWHREVALHEPKGESNGRSLLGSSCEPPSGSATSCESGSQDMDQTGRSTTVAGVMRQLLMRVRVPATDVATVDPHPGNLLEANNDPMSRSDAKSDSWEGKDWYETSDCSGECCYKDQDSAAEMSALESCKATAISCYEFVFAPEPEVPSASTKGGSRPVNAAHSQAFDASRNSARMGYRSRYLSSQWSRKQSPVKDAWYYGSTRSS